MKKSYSNLINNDQQFLFFIYVDTTQYSINVLNNTGEMDGNDSEIFPEKSQTPFV